MRIKEWTILRRLWRGIRPFKWPRRDRTAFEEDRRTIFRWRCSGSGPSTGHRRKGSQSSLRIGYYDGLFGSTFRQGSLPRSRTTNASSELMKTICKSSYVLIDDNLFRISQSMKIKTDKETRRKISRDFFFICRN